MKPYPFCLSKKEIEEIRKENLWQWRVIQYIINNGNILSKGEFILCDLFERSEEQWKNKLKKAFPEMYKEFKKCKPHLFEN